MKHKRHTKRCKDTFNFVTTLESGHDRHTTECSSCGAWLALGPSNDEAAAVQLELTAVELTELRSDQYADALRAGWNLHEREELQLPDLTAEELPADDAWLGGWLARQIQHHDASR